MKKLFSVLLSLLLFVSVFGISTNAFAQDTTIRTDEELKVNDTVEVPIYVDNGTNLLGFGFEVSYNEEVLQPVSVTKDELISNGSFNDSIGTDKYNNPFRVVWAGSSVLNNNGLLFTIKFNVIGSAKTTVTVKTMPNDTYDKDYNKVSVSELKIVIAQKCKHNYIETITKKPTCTETGIKKFECAICGNVYNETIAKLPKKANTLTVKAKKPTVKFTKLKKKNQTIALKNVMTVSKAQGKVTFKKASGNKKITVAKNGKITVKKGLKKGTYKIKVKVTAAGTAEYKTATKTVTIAIKVK